ncbi:MAG: hypothetical protein VW405_23365, partial [Rhodospirillaceae bacterium]
MLSQELARQLLLLLFQGARQFLLGAAALALFGGDFLLELVLFLAQPGGLAAQLLDPLTGLGDQLLDTTALLVRKLALGQLVGAADNVLRLADQSLHGRLLAADLLYGDGAARAVALAAADAFHLAGLAVQLQVETAAVRRRVGPDRA